MFVNFNLSMIVWMSLSESQPDVLRISFKSNFLMWLTIIVLHVAFLMFNFTFCKCTLMKDSEMKAIVITCSQKVLPSAITLIEFLPVSLQIHSVY